MKYFRSSQSDKFARNKYTRILAVPYITFSRELSLFVRSRRVKKEWCYLKWSFCEYCFNFWTGFTEQHKYMLFL